MQNPRTTILALGAYAALVAAIAATTQRPAYTQGAGKPAGPDVRVVNTQLEPVPVSLQGATKIDTSTPIPVSVQGPATINTSGPLPVRDIDRQPQEPVQFSLFYPTGIGTYTVPAGKWLVIEFVTGSFAINPSDTVADAQVFLTCSPGVTHVFPGTVTHYVTGSPVPSGFAFSEQCRIYAKSGATIKFSGGDLLSATVSGYLVDAP
jgi:hypothetical protein